MGSMRIFLSCCVIVAVAFAASAASLFTTTNTAPKLRLEFHIPANTDNDVLDFFVGFASSEGLTVEDAGAKMPPINGRRILFLALRKGGAVEVIVGNFLKDDQFLVSAYEHEATPAFTGIASRLTDQLKEKWPSTTAYRGP
jgi:hypothetical protein